MEQYIDFSKVLRFIKQYQQSSPRMMDFGYGDIVYFINDSGTTNNYPFVFVTPQSITYDENTTTYQLQIIFGDLVNTSLSNEKDVVSDMSLEARRFLSEIKRGFLDEKMDISLPVLSQPFFERFNDHIGGVVLDANLIVFEDINACDYYPVPTPCEDPNPNPTLILITDRSAGESDTIWIESYTQGTTTLIDSYYPIPEELTLNITLHAVNGKNYSYDFTLPKYSTYNEFNITGLTEGYNVSATTQNALYGVPECWTINYSNSWQVKRCSDGFVYANLWMAPFGTDWTGHIFRTGPSALSCAEVVGRATNQYNINQTFNPATLYTDCVDCTSS